MLTSKDRRFVAGEVTGHDFYWVRRIEFIWSSRFVELVAELFQDFLRRAVRAATMLKIVQGTRSADNPPLNVISADVHDHGLILEDDLIVEGDISLRSVYPHGWHSDQISLQVLVRQLSDYSQTLSTGTCTETL